MKYAPCEVHNSNYHWCLGCQKIITDLRLRSLSAQIEELNTTIITLEFQLDAALAHQQDFRNP